MYQIIPGILKYSRVLYTRVMTREHQGLYQSIHAIQGYVPHTVQRIYEGTPDDTRICVAYTRIHKACLDISSNSGDMPEWSLESIQVNGNNCIKVCQGYECMQEYIHQEMKTMLIESLSASAFKWIAEHWEYNLIDWDKFKWILLNLFKSNIEYHRVFNIVHYMRE